MTAKREGLSHSPTPMLLRSTSSYVRDLKPELSREAFQPARSRLLWLPVHVGVVAAGFAVLSAGWVPWSLAAGVSLLIGLSFAGLTFLAHEVLHGAVVRGLQVRRLVGMIGFLPFMIAPRLWIAWHNRVHHGNTNHPGVDPDAFPTIEEYRSSRVLRIVTDHLGIGRQRQGALFSLFIGFSVQSAHMLFAARARGYLSGRQHTFALLESGFAFAVWAVLAVSLGPLVFLFAYVLPMFVANGVVMGFILTNHSLSPHANVNDPLINSLSVTAPRLVEWFTLRFGFHVEHHLFPWMSSRHAPEVRALVRARWPERYQSMPLVLALLALHRTGRVYKDSTTLADLPGGKEWPTLLPRDKSHVTAAPPAELPIATGMSVGIGAE